MSDNKFDLNKLKENVGGLMGSIKSMINPAGGIVQADPDDALGVKFMQISTLVKQMMDVQHEQVKNLAKVNELLNAVFKEIEVLRKNTKKE